MRVPCAPNNINYQWSLSTGIQPVRTVLEHDAGMEKGGMISIYIKKVLEIIQDIEVLKRASAQDEDD